MITNSRGKVGRFCLFKSAYKLGEDIVGTFDFSVGTVTCMQVSSGFSFTQYFVMKWLCYSLVELMQPP